MAENYRIYHPQTMHQEGYFEDGGIPIDIKPDLIVGCHTDGAFMDSREPMNWLSIISALTEKLDSLGEKYKRINIAWPRNFWTLFNNGVYLDNQAVETPNSKKVPLGNFGQIIEGDDFIVLSSAACEKDPDFVIKELKKASGVEKIYILNWLKVDYDGSLTKEEKYAKRCYRDIDLSFNYIPFTNTFVVYGKHYKQEQKTIDKIVSDQNADLILSYETFAPNMLILGEKVFAYSCRYLCEDLLKKGIEVYKISHNYDTYDQFEAGASLRCFTNWIHPEIFSRLAKTEKFNGGLVELL